MLVDTTNSLRNQPPQSFDLIRDEVINNIIKKCKEMHFGKEEVTIKLKKVS